MFMGMRSSETRLWPRFAVALGLVACLVSVCTSLNAAEHVVSDSEMQGILGQLEDYAVGEMQKQAVPGMAYAVVKDDQIVYAKGFGVREAGGSQAVNKDTVFEIGSTTKAFTATLVGMLVDDRKLAWTDPVTTHLPDFKMKDPWVTRQMEVVDLLCQRSGMPEYSLDTMSLLGFQRPAVTRAVRWVVPDTSFRTTFEYVNTLYVAAGQLIEAKRGRTWEEDLSERLLQPLDMNSSTTDPDAARASGNLATGHVVLSDGSLWPIPEGWTYAGWLQTYGPAGGIYSNVVDMAQWIRFQLHGGELDGTRLVSPESMAAMRAPRTFIGNDVTGSSASYALGWIGVSEAPEPFFWHNGGTFGMHSIIGFIPGAGVGIVLLTNTDGNDVPEMVLRRFYDLYFHKPLDEQAPPLRGVDTRRPFAFQPIRGTAHPLPADAISRFVGSYVNPAYGRFTVDVRSGVLVLTMGPARIEAPMMHIQGNIFVATLPDYPEGEMPVRFVANSDGAVTAMIVPLCADVDGGQFAKE